MSHQFRADTLKLQGARKRMVDELRATMAKMNLADESVLDAMMTVPRHVFFDSVFDSGYAYENKAFPIGAGQTISQPLTVAVQSTLMEIKKRDKVLEIGTGSGYQSAVLDAMGAKVFTIERQKSLYDKTSKLLPQMGHRCKFFFTDGFKGLPTFAPFDKVIITCGAPHIPKALLQQMKVGGIMVIPVGEGEEQEMLRITRKSENEFEQTSFGMFSFVPMLENTDDKK